MVFKRKLDTKMRDAGEIDYEKKTIRVNPRKTNRGGLMDTIVHEELHKDYPDKPEKWISKKTKTKVKSLSDSQAQRLLKKYIFREKKKGKK